MSPPFPSVGRPTGDKSGLNVLFAAALVIWLSLVRLICGDVMRIRPALPAVSATCESMVPETREREFVALIVMFPPPDVDNSLPKPAALLVIPLSSKRTVGAVIVIGPPFPPRMLKSEAEVIPEPERRETLSSAVI